MALAGFSFTHTLRVRWAEVDKQGIVFNGHYLTYFDVAFTEYWRRLGLPSFVAQAEAGYEMFARKNEIEYLAPARFDDELEIGVRCLKLGNSSVQFGIEIWRPEGAVSSLARSSQDRGEILPAQHLISGSLLYVYADAHARKPVPLPQSWRDTFLQFEQTPPAQS